MPAFDTHSPLPDVKAGGALLPDAENKIRRVVVEAQRNLPAMCEVELSDDDLTVVDNPMLRPGAPLTVETAPASDDPTQTSVGPIFDGEIVAIEAMFPAAGGSRLVIRGYDRSHRLHRTRRTRTFLRQSDNMIASTIASDCGLAPRVGATGGPHEYLCQRNQTDWEFLAERAREIGFEVSVSPQPGGQSALVFRKAGKDPLAGVPQRLEHGDNLLSFRLRSTSAEQAESTTVRSWDPMLRDELTVLAPPPAGENAPGDHSLAAASVASQFGSTEDVVTDRPFGVPQGEAALGHATARREHTASVSFEAEGSCTGNPAMVPGGQVDIDQLGKRFSGTYTLTVVRHVFDEGGFVTQFTISGTNDRSLLGLAQPGAAWHAGPGASGNGGPAVLATPVVGTVTNTNDPKQSARVKVEFPWLGESVESHWAPVVSVGAGDGKGMQVIPEVGDQVLVVFEHADVRRPYVLGGIWGQPSELPESQQSAVRDGQTIMRVLKTPAGHRVELIDHKDDSGIRLYAGEGPSLEVMDAPEEWIRLGVGRCHINIGTAERIIALRSEGDLALEAGGRLTLKATGGIEVDGGGGPVSVKSSASLSLDGGAAAELKGATVKIN